MPTPMDIYKREQEEERKRNELEQLKYRLKSEKFPFKDIYEIFIAMAKRKGIY